MGEELRSLMEAMSHAQQYVVSNIQGVAPSWIYTYLTKHEELLSNNIYLFLYKGAEQRLVEDLIQLHAQIGQPSTREVERKNLKASIRMQINSRGESVEAYGEFVAYLHDLIQEYQNKA